MLLTALGVLWLCCSCVRPASDVTKSTIAAPAPTTAVSVPATVTATAPPTLGTQTISHPAKAPVNDFGQLVRPIASEHGVQIANVSTAVYTTAGIGDLKPPGRGTPTPLARPPELRYIAAYIAFLAPEHDATAEIVPDPTTMAGTDSNGRRYPLTYVEIARLPGLTLGAIRFRGAQQGRKVFRLEVQTVRVAAGLQSERILGGLWVVDLANQVSDEPRGGSTTTMGGSVPSNSRVALRAAPTGAGTRGNSAAFVVERPGAPPQLLYAQLDAQTGEVLRLETPAGDCYFRGLLGAPVRPIEPTSPLKPAPPATATPAGFNCHELAGPLDPISPLSPVAPGSMSGR